LVPIIKPTREIEESKIIVEVEAKWPKVHWIPELLLERRQEIYFSFFKYGSWEYALGA
jgi:hypothetical protein